MREIKQKRKVRRILFSKPVIGLLAVLVFLMGSAVWGIFEKYLDTREKRMGAEASVIELEERKERLSEEIQHLETKEGVEEEIRENFGFAKEGERVVIIVEGEEVETRGENKNTGFWGSFLKIFFRGEE